MIADLVATLARRPFSLSPEQAGRLTIRQVEQLARRVERNIDQVPEGPSERELFWWWGRQQKLRDYQIQELWGKAHQRENDGRNC